MALTALRRAFADEYMRNGFNASAAYVTVSGSSAKKPSYPYTMLKDPDVKAYIEQRRNEIYETLCIDAMRVMEELAKIAFGPITEENSTTSKLKALELLSKNLSLATQKVETKDTIEVSIVE